MMVNVADYILGAKEKYNKTGANATKKVTFTIVSEYCLIFTVHVHSGK